MEGNPLFPHYKLPDVLIADLRRLNPWWEGKPGSVLPKTRRHLVEQITRRLENKTAPVVMVRGPRQIGKSTAQLQVIDDYLTKEGRDARTILRVQFDELDSLRGVEQPILRIVEWFESAVLRKTLNESAHAGVVPVLFFDEVQNLSRWAEQLKSLVDHATVQVVVTGSSALRIDLGRESLAGRISPIDVGTLSLTEIAGFRGIKLGPPTLADNGLEPLTRRGFWQELREHGIRVAPQRDECFRHFSQRGGYPLAHEKSTLAWPQIADQLNETVIKRVIQHDLRVGERGRKRDAPLLEELFRLSCRYAGQATPPATFAREAQRALNANIGINRVRVYMKFLHDALLIRLIQPLEIRLKRARGNPKICLADHGLRASWLQEIIPMEAAGLDANPHLTDLAGRIAESVVGATLSTINGLDIAWVPEKPNAPEVDFVLTVGTVRIPLEVKFRRRIHPMNDTEGLRAFVENKSNNAPFAILVTQDDDQIVPDPRIVCLPLSTLMLLR